MLVMRNEMQHAEWKQGVRRGNIMGAFVILNNQSINKMFLSWPALSSLHTNEN